MWIKAYVDERSNGLVEILVKAHKGFYKLWVHPNNPAEVEVMVDGILKGRARGKLVEFGGEETKTQKSRGKQRAGKWKSQKRRF